MKTPSCHRSAGGPGVGTGPRPRSQRPPGARKPVARGRWGLRPGPGMDKFPSAAAVPGTGPPGRPSDPTAPSPEAPSPGGSGREHRAPAQRVPRPTHSVPSICTHSREDRDNSQGAWPGGRDFASTPCCTGSRTKGSLGPCSRSLASARTAARIETTARALGPALGRRTPDQRIFPSGPHSRPHHSLSEGIVSQTIVSQGTNQDTQTKPTQTQTDGDTRRMRQGGH